MPASTRKGSSECKIRFCMQIVVLCINSQLHECRFRWSGDRERMTARIAKADRYFCQGTTYQKCIEKMLPAAFRTHVRPNLWMHYYNCLQLSLCIPARDSLHIWCRVYILWRSSDFHTDEGMKQKILFVDSLTVNDFSLSTFSR